VLCQKELPLRLKNEEVTKVWFQKAVENLAHREATHGVLVIRSPMLGDTLDSYTLADILIGGVLAR
jgi:hypothetical protein